MFAFLKRLFGKTREQRLIAPAAASITVSNAQISAFSVAPKVIGATTHAATIAEERRVVRHSPPIPSPLNVFGFVLHVLESHYPCLAETIGPEVNDNIVAQLQTFREGYGSLNLGYQPCYATELSRFAYVYGYAPARANAVYDALRQTPEIQSLFDRQELHIACLGGGPGSDLLGIGKHLARREMEASKQIPKVSATVCDRVGHWNDWWEAFEHNLTNGPSAMPIRARYLSHDILEPSTWDDVDELAVCELYTISYCMGEFRTHQSAAEPYFDRVFANAASGSWFVFVDNNHPRDFEWFDRTRYKHGLSVVHRSSGAYKPEHAELDVAGSCYNGKYGDARTNMTINRAVRVCVKQ